MSASPRCWQAEHTVDVETDPNEALFRAAEGNYDLVIVSLGAARISTALRLCSQLRSLERTRNLPILAHRRRRGQCAAGARPRDRRQRLSDAPDRQERTAGARAHADPQEALHRAAARQRAAVDRDGDHRRADRPATIAATWRAISATLVEQAAARGKPLTVLVLDIDYFKSINDTYGHDAGDDVLREFAIRMRKSIRGIDLACRYGGEEFVVVMPETDMAVATMVAERLRRRIAAEPFPIEQGTQADRGHDLDRHRDARRRRRHRGRTCSSAPTRRSIAPSATAATAWSPTRPRDSVHFQVLSRPHPEERCAATRLEGSGHSAGRPILRDASLEPVSRVYAALAAGYAKAAHENARAFILSPQIQIPCRSRRFR